MRIQYSLSKLTFSFHVQSYVIRVAVVVMHSGPEKQDAIHETSQGTLTSHYIQLESRDHRVFSQQGRHFGSPRDQCVNQSF